MKRRLSTLTLLFFVISITAQTVSIKGSISSNENESVDGYNLILLHPKDSSIYRGNFFRENHFHIAVEQKELPLIMKITSLGYEDKFLWVDKNRFSFPAIKLKRSTTILSELQVKASTPLFVAKSDRITMNVDNTVLSQSGTVLDVLQKSARVKVDENNISVLGLGKAIVIIDGKTIHSTQILESIASDDIDKIDIISSPSAKYAASGKAVIEISTKKGKTEAWGGSISSRIGKGANWRKQLGAQLSVKNSKLSLYANYFYSPNKRQNSEMYERKKFNTKEQLESLNEIDINSAIAVKKKS